MKKHIVTALAIFFGNQVFSQGEPIVLEQVSAVIGNQAIFKSDVDIQLAQLESQGIPVTNQSYCYVWEEQLFEKLLMHRAEVDSIEVSEEEVNAELDRRMNYMLMQMGGSEVEFQKYYNKTVREFKEEVRSTIENNMRAQRVQAKIAGNVQISPQEVEDYYNNIPKDSLPIIQEQYKIGQIIITAKPSEYEKQRVKGEMEALRQSIVQGGMDFGLQALINSEDPGSAQNKGDLGFLSRDQLVTEFSAAAFKLNPGEISEVVESQFGFHIIQMIEKKGNLIHCRHILKMPKTYSFDFKKAEILADSIVKAIRGGADFGALAKKYSADPSSSENGGILRNPQNGSSFFESTQLDQQTFFQVQNLKKGEASNPSVINAGDGSQALRILVLQDKLPFHTANIKTDYERIKQEALSQKKRKVVDAWVLNHLDDTYLKLPMEAKPCENLQVWFAKMEAIK